MTPETIYALSSGRGRAGIAVIRLSGPAARSAAGAVGADGLAARRARRVTLSDPASGEHLDESVAVFFPEPASFTGEDVVELYVHGGPAVVGGVLEALARDDALRMAVPGEFTRRAFETGKLDLTRAEAVADLIDAETAAQRRQALRQGGGALARLCDDWRERLVAALAHWEAAIDFSDEELPADLEAGTAAAVAELIAELAGHLDDAHQGERLRDGIHLAIIGPPNAGKSSLLNLLAKRDVAIVSETAGTTRDVLEVHLDLGGYPVIAADTAGLRDSAEPIEMEGVRRARARAGAADLQLLLFDSADWPPRESDYREFLGPRAVVAVNKIDLKSPAPPATLGGLDATPISVRTGAGIEALLAALEAKVAEGFDAAQAPVVTRARHRDALQACRQALERFADRESRMVAPEIAAEDLRLAAQALGRVTGRVDVEDLLDVIFSEFCIGK